MSGGVDSSVAAALLQKQGYDCTGIFMCFGQPDTKSTSHKACCTPEDARDAKEVSQSLGIRFATLNFQEDIEKLIDYFIDEYRNARTPNPCIICNSKFKFGKLLKYAEAMEADYVATGHYAQLREADDQLSLSRAIDINKDQSYALFDIPKRNLKKIKLPLGAYTKAEVRQMAADMKLPVHNKPESQEICFVGDDDYSSFLSRRAPELIRPGAIVDSSGKQLGEHDGIFRYTIGQRRGLGVAMGEPYYVVALDRQSNTVVLGPKAELMKTRLIAKRVNWLTDSIPAKDFKAVVQIRYNHRGAAATVTPAKEQDEVVVDFDEPVSAITPGQAAVFYDENQNIIGGGWIKSDG